MIKSVGFLCFIFQIRNATQSHVKLVFFHSNILEKYITAVLIDIGHPEDLGVLRLSIATKLTKIGCTVQFKIALKKR